MGSKPCVLVTDGQERAALAITRSLGQAGLRVVVGAETQKSLAGASKYCHRTWQYPSPLADPSGCEVSLMETVRRFEIAAIMPVTDVTLQIVINFKDQLQPSVTQALPTHESYDLVSGKYRLMKLALELGPQIAKTVFVPDGKMVAVRVRLACIQLL